MHGRAGADHGNRTREREADAARACARLVSEKLFALDTVEHARHIGEFSYAEGGYLSPDGFLYARCRAVAKGRTNYEKTLADPRAMPKDLDFETLLYLAPMAYEEATGEEGTTTLR